jgi:hypothetical protein
MLCSFVEYANLKNQDQKSQMKMEKSFRFSLEKLINVKLKYSIALVNTKKRARPLKKNN